MEDVFPDLVMDACCLINLYAAGILSPVPPPESEPVRRKVIKPKAIRAEPAKRAMQRSALAFNLHVPAKVMEESLYIRKPDDARESQLDLWTHRGAGEAAGGARHLAGDLDFG